MKKSLFLLPILAVAALAACNGGSDPTKPDDPVNPTPHTHVDANKDCICDSCFAALEHVDVNLDYVCDTCGKDLPGKPVPVTDLHVTIDYAAISATTGTKTGYDAVSAVTSVGGATVSFSNVCINNLNSKSKPAWTTPNDEKVQVVQFKNPTNGCGVVTFPNAKLSKVTINLLSSWDVSNDFTVTHGSSVIPMVAGEGQTTGYTTGEYAIKKYALTFTVNASEGADLVIKNQGSGARYVESIVIE